jgi:hypothetical protein
MPAAKKKAAGVSAATKTTSRPAKISKLYHPPRHAGGDAWIQPGDKLTASQEKALKDRGVL